MVSRLLQTVLSRKVAVLGGVGHLSSPLVCGNCLFFLLPADMSSRVTGRSSKEHTTVTLHHG